MGERITFSRIWGRDRDPTLVLGGLVLLLLLLSPLPAAAKGPSSRIDDGGLTVPSHLPSTSGGQVIGLKNRPLSLHCPIIVDREKAKVLDLWWAKDGYKLDLNSQVTQVQAVVPPPPRIYITEDGDLHFEKIIHKITPPTSSRSSDLNSNSRHAKNYTDQGEYTCFVKSEVGVVFGPIISLSVAALEVGEEQAEVKVKGGQPVLLECPITSTPPLSSSSVTWTQGEKSISAQENRFSLLSCGTLAILNVQSQDAGIYRCHASHDLLGVNKSANVKLVVDHPNEVVVSQEPPKFLFPLDSQVQNTIVLDEDEEGELDCVVSGIPMPIITWVLTYDIENGTTRTPLTKILSEGKGYHDTVDIFPENSVERGNYTCVATNGVGSPISKTIQVVRLPAIIKNPISHKYPAAKTVRFECKVGPTFTLIWYKDGQRLETGKGRVKAKGNEIVISNTIRNDSGYYQCEVVGNGKVYGIGTARLYIENDKPAPDAPFDLKCVQSYPRAFVVSWKVANRDGIAYTIHYTPIGGEEMQKVAPSRTHNFTIDNLRPFTNYSIYVRSYSAKSASGRSQEVICSTLEDIPAKPLREFVFEQYGPPSQIRVRWKPLSHSEARGKVILYKLQWKSVNSETINVRYVDGESDEFLITDLVVGESIELRLFPSTSAGWPKDKESSPWTLVNSTKNSLSNEDANDAYSPPTMDLMVLNSSSILVNWSEPKRQKVLALKGFRLGYSTEVGRVEDFVFFGPLYIYNYAEREHLFTDFVPSTSYEVYLQTFGDEWESEVTSRFIRTFSDGDEDFPSSSFLPAVSGLHVSPVSSSEMRLTWEKPKTLDPQSHYYYTVKYNKLDETNSRYLSSTSESVEIQDLKPFTSYEFSVQLLSDDGGGGPFSQKVESRTLPGIPGPPVQLHWRVLNQSLVEVEWHPPSPANGIIQKYWVQYKHKNDTLASQKNNEPSWKSKTTGNTSLFLDELMQNQDYVVRVTAETKAGFGDPSDTIVVRIFNKKPDSPPPSDGTDGSKTSPIQITKSSQELGVIIGISLSLLFIIVCVIIILSRHHLFPILTRQPLRVNANGNGYPPRAKRSVDSFTGVEMKQLEGVTSVELHLDTKGSLQTQSNGIIPGPTDPLLVRIVRNPIDNPRGEEEEEEDTIPNCTH